MDWNGIIDRNREALKRVLAALVAMALIAEGAPTLPRHLHRAVLRLLRPAEAAARRLVVVVARGLPAPAPPPSVKPEPIPVVPRKGARIVKVNLGLAGYNAAPPPSKRPRPGTLSLLLIDPLRLPRLRRYVRVRSVPRIWTLGMARPAPLPPPLSPNDPLDASRLVLRLQALGRALEDLPAQARRLVRWKARRDRAHARGRPHRCSPLRPGRPPGWRRRSAHEVHEVLKDLQYFARHALERPDTS